METTEQKSLYTHSLTVGGIFGAAYTIVNLLILYIAVGTGSTGLGMIAVYCLGICGISLAAGYFATWTYISDIMMPIETGQGALIGFLAGIALAVVSFVFQLVLNSVGLDSQELTSEFMMAFLSDLGLSGQELQDVEDQMQSSGSGVFSLLISMVVLGLLNCITGLIAASIHSKKYKQTDAL